MRLGVDDYYHFVMGGPMRLHRSLSLVGLAAATIGSAVAMPAAAQPASVQAEEARPALSVMAVSDKVTLPRRGESVRLGGLGAYLVAGDDPFEVTATRSSYADPVVGHWLRPDGTTVELSQDMVRDFRRLRGFIHVRVRNLDGKLVANQEHGMCVNRYGAVRSRPDAPDTSPYPTSCGGGWMPWTLGSFWGLQAGWGVGVPGDEAKLPLGRYVATVRIDEDYRKLLDIPKDDAYTEIKLRVVKGGADGCHEDRGCRLDAADDSRRYRPAAHEPAGTDRPLAGDPLPDLRSLPAWGIGVHKGDVLHFSANVWNAGPSPLVIDGFRRQNEEMMDSYQYFYDADGNVTGSAEIGHMHWHSAPSHNHWHFLDFARYRLLDADKQSVVLSRKQSFCLANTDAIDYTVPEANWDPWNTDLNTACGGHNALGVREVLDVGSGDTYGQWRAGQAFRLKGLPNGKYFVEIAANPFGNVYETDETNNVSYRKIFIGGKPGHRTVRVAPVGLVDVK
jgi:Lysyl oxidase